MTSFLQQVREAAACHLGGFACELGLQGLEGDLFRGGKGVCRFRSLHEGS